MLIPYRILSVVSANRGYELVSIDIVKNEYNHILAISNTSLMVESLATLKECRDYVKSKEDIDFVISNKMGLIEDYVFITNSISKKDKNRIFINYRDAYPSVSRAMHSKPSRPIAGVVFNQDQSTGDWNFFLENVDPKTFSVMFAIDTVLKANGKLMIEELKR